MAPNWTCIATTAREYIFHRLPQVQWWLPKVDLELVIREEIYVLGLFKRCEPQNQYWQPEISAILSVYYICLSQICFFIGVVDPSTGFVVDIGTIEAPPRVLIDHVSYIGILFFLSAILASSIATREMS